jgi:spore coat assembly protein
MDIKIGDYVSRKSYDNDIIFKVINIKDDTFYLKGADVRLYADSYLEDLIKEEIKETVEEKNISNELEENNNSDRGDFFYLPAKILHIDGDSDYLDRCLKYYKNLNVYAVGKKISEEKIFKEITPLLEEYKPDIVIITGHDAFYKKMGDTKDIRNYKNSLNFVNAVKMARKYEKSHDKLVIIAGACQSDYEELIKAGANFASSPKRINIHALDPAIIAANLALTERNKEIDLLSLLEKTKYGKDGIGGLKSNGLMFVGYPR